MLRPLLKKDLRHSPWMEPVSGTAKVAKDPRLHSHEYRGNSTIITPEEDTTVWKRQLWELSMLTPTLPIYLVPESQ